MGWQVALSLVCVADALRISKPREVYTHPGYDCRPRGSHRGDMAGGAGPPAREDTPKCQAPEGLDTRGTCSLQCPAHTAQPRTLSHRASGPGLTPSTKRPQRGGNSAGSTLTCWWICFRPCTTFSSKKSEVGLREFKCSVRCRESVREPACRPGAPAPTCKHQRGGGPLPEGASSQQDERSAFLVSGSWTTETGL